MPKKEASVACDASTKLAKKAIKEATNILLKETTLMAKGRLSAILRWLLPVDAGYFG